MEVKHGYKQTEVGVIPKDWDVKPLGVLIASLEAGVSVNSIDKNIFSSDKFILKTSSVIGGKFIPGECKSIVTRDIHRVKLSPSKDTIIISRMNTPGLVGECGYVNQDYPRLFLPDRLWMMRPKNSVLHCVRWLVYLLSSNSFNRVIKECATGTSGSMKNISKKSLFAVSIPFPPTKIEQITIAKALSDVDEFIESLEQLITKKLDFQQGTMQKLLTGKKRLPGFNGGWKIRRLGDLAVMRSGGTPTSTVPSFYDGDFPWVSISDMTKCGKVVTGTDRSLSDEGLAHSAAQMFPKGTVLYAMYASLGKCCIAGISLCTSQAILGICPQDRLNNEFLYYYLTSLKSTVKSMGQHGTQANLNKGMVQNFKIQLPSLPEQTAIAGVLSDIDAELEMLERCRNKTRDLKKGMMQELLTGRIRLL